MMRRFALTLAVFFLAIPEAFAALPAKAINSVPVNGAVNQDVNITLRWENGGGATSYKVYFGTKTALGSKELQGTTTNTFFQSPKLNYATKYYWRVDSVNSSGTTTGTVWSFNTMAALPLPGKATNPVPANGAVNQPLNATLSWTAATGATSYDVYLSTSSKLISKQKVATVSNTSYAPAALVIQTNYFWRIDSRNSRGITVGDVWRFTTRAAEMACDFQIQEGGFTKTSQITLLITSSSAYELQISERADFSAAVWRPYAPVVPFVLAAGDGTKTVYMKFRNIQTQAEQQKNRQVTLDMAAPTMTIVAPQDGMQVTGK